METGTIKDPTNNPEPLKPALPKKIQEEPADDKVNKHHKHHTSALHAAGVSHSAVNHVMPRHRGLDL